jgi:hypothetical protein
MCVEKRAWNSSSSVIPKAAISQPVASGSPAMYSQPVMNPARG